MNKKKLGLTMLSASLLAAAFFSFNNKSFASYFSSSNVSPPVEIIQEPNIDSLKQIITLDTFVWNDSTYNEFKDLIGDTVFGGYSSENKNFNRFHVLQKSGKNLTKEIDSLGKHKFAELIDQKVGVGGSLDDLFENLQRYNSLYKEKASKHNIDRRLLLAVGVNESRLDPYAISYASCLGLNQLNNSVYKEKNPFIIEQNVETSANLLHKLLRHYGGNDTLALTAYNRGRSGLNKVIRKAKAEGITSAKDIINFREGGKYLLSREARAYAKKTFMYKELIRQYQPNDGEKMFRSRLATLEKSLKESSNS